MEYFKLGPKANYFYDFASQVSITRGKIVAFITKPGSKLFKNALRNQHIVSATEAEYFKYKGIVPEPPKVEELPKDPEPVKEQEAKVDLTLLSKEEILEMYAWFDGDDLKKAKAIKAKKALIKFVTETEKMYE